VAQQDVLVVTW